MKNSKTLVATIEEAQIRFEVLVAIDAAVDRCVAEIQLRDPALSAYSAVVCAERQVCDDIHPLLNGLANPDVSAAEYEQAYAAMADAGEVWGTRALTLIEKTNSKPVTEKRNKPLWALAAALEEAAIDIQASGEVSSFAQLNSLEFAERALAQDRTPEKAFVIQRDSIRFA